MATILDVAKLAGVSAATVSRVINHTAPVNPETRSRVTEAIEALDFEPNQSARNLLLNESRVVLVLARNYTNPYYSQVLAGISDVTREAGYKMLLCKNDGEVSETVKYFGMLPRHSADGAILLNCTAADEWLRDYIGKYPMVFCCEYAPGFDIPKIRPENERDAYTATRYLLSLGHTRIAFMGADNAHISTFEREEGYRRAMAEAGLEVLITRGDGDYSFESGRKSTEKLLDMREAERPTALLCISDILARGAILAASDRGLDVPGDLSVIGWDDVDYTTMWHPFLTTVHIPCYELGAESARMLLSYMKTLPERCPDRLVETKLIVRESCAPARK